MLPKEKEKLDPRVKRTRKLLQTAFMELLDEKGFRAVTVKDISKRAEINRATFYGHFRDKYGLLNYVVREMFREKIASRSLNFCQLNAENLHALIVTVCEFVAMSSARCVPSQPLFESLVESQIKDELYTILRFWLAQDSPDQVHETAATAASWAIYGLALQWSRQKDSVPAETFADQVLPLISANVQLAPSA